MNNKQANALLTAIASDYLKKLLPQEVTDELADSIAEAGQIVENEPELKNWYDKFVILEHWDGLISEAKIEQVDTILDKVKSALFNGKQISLDYNNSPAGKFNIFGLISRDKQIYLSGSYGQSQAPYLLSLRNISQLEILNSSIVEPLDNFVLRDFAETHLNFFNSNNMIDELIIEFPRAVYSYVKSNQLHAKEVELIESDSAPGFFRLIAKQVNNNQGLQQWLLGFNNKAQVIEPIELRQIINYSDIDKLTNLYNRNVFERLLNREIDWCHRDSSHYFSLSDSI